MLNYQRVTKKEEVCDYDTTVANKLLRVVEMFLTPYPQVALQNVLRSNLLLSYHPYKTRSCVHILALRYIV